MTLDRDALKREAASYAVAQISDGMVVGLGTGSTAAFAVEALGERVRRGLRIVGIPTSERTAAQARALGITLTDFAQHPEIDLTFDGADEALPGRLDLIKGLGGALLREKIVAAASRRLLIMVDDLKLVRVIGEKAPVPVEVVAFGWQATERALVQIGAETTLRLNANGAPFVTDGGNLILDCRFGPIADAAALEAKLSGLVGVVESGLFTGLADQVIVAAPDGVKVLERG